MQKTENTIIRDRVGVETDLSLCPECPRADCFACLYGHCTALKTAEENCRFHKSTDDAMREIRRCYQRIKDKGRSDLLRRYKATNIALGLLDDDIREMENYGSIFDAFRESDYREQMERALSHAETDNDLLEDDDDPADHNPENMAPPETALEDDDAGHD